MKKLVAEQNSQREKNNLGLMGVLVFVAVILLVVQVAAANRLVEAADKLRYLDLEISATEKQNDALSEELRGQESLSAISRAAEKMGFSKETKITFLENSTNPVAFEGLLR